MNKVRRKKINLAGEKLRLVIQEVELLLDEEVDYHDNIPENLQFSLRADESEESIDQLQELIEKMEEIADDLEMI